MFVSKKKHEALKEELEKEVRRSAHTENELESRIRESILLEQKNKELEEQLEQANAKLEEVNSAFAEENSVTLIIDDTLTHVTPYVKVREDVFDKMVELHYLNDAVNPETKGMSMQLALLTIASDGLDQILDAFSSPIDTVDE